MRKQTVRTLRSLCVASIGAVAALLTVVASAFADGGGPAFP
jgi:hypothetical protein